MKKLASIAVAALLMAVGHSAQAQILTGTATWANTGSTGPLPTLTIFYQVFLSAGLYTYDYTVTSSSSGNPANVFSVDASFVNPGSANLGGFIGTGIVSWSSNSGFAPGTEFQYTSNFGPTLGGGAGSDGVPSVSWSATSSANTGSQLIPVPVPEASTVMAGALMLLPLGIGAVRAIRKERTA